MSELSQAGLVLLVEDDAGIAELVRDKLSEQGQTVVHVSTGRAASAWLTLTRPQLMLLDYSLPDMSGLELTEQLAALPAGLPPFIVTTGAGDERIAVTMMKRGARDYLVKDSRFLDDLSFIVERVLREVATEQQLARAAQALRESEKRVLIQRDILLTLASASDLTVALSRVLDAVCELPGVDSGGVYLPDDAGDLELVAQRGLSAIFTQIEATRLIPKATRHFQLILLGKPVYASVGDETISYREAMAAEGMRAAAILPILHEGKLLASLNLASSAIDNFPPDTRAALETIATQIGMMLARLKAEEKLRESEERFHSLYNNTTIGLYRTTPDGHILMSNPAGVRMLGFTSFEEIAQRNLEQEGFEPDYPRRVFREKLEREGTLVGLESKWTKKDGSTIFVRESATAVRDALGRVLYYDGTFEDVTERKLAEAALLESEKQYRQMFTGHSAVMLLIEPETAAIVEANPAAAAYYSYPLDVLQQMRITQISTLSPDKIIREMQAARLRQRSYFIFRHRLASGEVRDVGVYSVPIEVKGRTLLYSIVHDITERKRAEEALRELNAQLEQRVAARTQELSEANARLIELGQLKDQFIADISHELRTPLFNIKIHYYNLLHSDNAEKRAYHQQVITDKIAELEQKIKDLLAVSHLSLEQYDLDYVPLAVNTLLDELISDQAELASRRQLTLRAVLAADLPSVTVDKALLRQALMNLLLNALSYTPAGSAIEISTGHRMVDDNTPVRAGVASQPHTNVDCASAAVGERRCQHL